jgi:hypothetical protein
MKMLRWFATNLLGALILYLGVVCEITGWGIALMILTYVMFGLTALLSFFGLPNFKVEYNVPRWIDIIYDIIYVGVLLWFGWYATGLAYAATMFAAHINSMEKHNEDLPSAGTEEQAGIQGR